jgi:hypothetical protein
VSVVANTVVGVNVNDVLVVTYSSAPTMNYPALTSAATTLAFTVPTFSYPAGAYHFQPVVALYPDQPHVGGVTCYAINATPTESGNVCSGSTLTYSAPITITTSEILNVLFTKSGQSDTTASAAYTGIGASPQTYYVTATGGTRYSSAVLYGQCNGLYNASYASVGGVTTNTWAPSTAYALGVEIADNTGHYETVTTAGTSGTLSAYPTWGATTTDGTVTWTRGAAYATDGNCAFNDVRYLWSDNSGNPNAWVIAGGDTAVIYGCQALGSQQNPSNPNCRLGYDNSTSGNYPNSWCGYGNPSGTCYNPPIPMGSSSQPTKILGGCAYGTYTCTPINNNYPYGTTNETQLFGGFALTWIFNLQGANYATIEGLELTTHNLYNGPGSGQCTGSVGTPAYPVSCNGGTPYSDYGGDGLSMDGGNYGVSTAQNITLQDIYIHGMAGAGLNGPLGGPINMTRVFSGFNALAGWMFDDDDATANGTGASITANYVTMDFNGCYEEYPIVHTYPARVCYDTNDSGFGDSWSGQGSGGTGAYLSFFTCNYCVDDYNTKDGFIGPHIIIPTITITHSVSIGNMGADWKWGGIDAYPNTTTFTNNLTVGNCTRMEAPMTGVPTTFNQYLTGFCRAGGNAFANVLPAGSVWNIENNTFITAQQILFYAGCSGATETSCPATVNSTNNVFLGYDDPNNPYQGGSTLYYFPGSTTINASHNIEYGMVAGTGTCPSTANGMLCEDPKLLNEPAQPWPGTEGDLDVFNPFIANNSFYPTSTSPLLGTGTTYSGIPSTDYYGVATTSPPVIGGVNYVTIAAVGYFYGGKMFGAVIH